MLPSVILLAFGTARADENASENFSYAAGSELSGGTANGGSGWDGGWQSPPGVTGGLKLDDTAQSLWLGNSPSSGPMAQAL